MGGSSSEEKNLPASAKKLRDARAKGQIAKAPDLVTAFASVAAIGYLMVGSGTIGEYLRQAITLTADLVVLPFPDALRLVFMLLWQTAMLVVGPLLAVVLLAVVIGSVAANGGFMLVMDPLMPKLETLDPIKGFGKLFKLKNLVEVLKSILKAIVLGTVAVKMALAAATPLMNVPNCGMRCIGPLSSGMFRPMLSAACGLYLLSGVIDLLLQKWMFKREMKMSVTEQRRERKDQDGDPYVRRAQRQRRREAATAIPLGLNRATLLVAGDDAAIGLRYVRGETDFPTVVCKAAGLSKAETMVATARGARTPVFWDNEFALALTAKLKPGDRIAQEFFQRVAQALYSTGVVRN